MNLELANKVLAVFGVDFQLDDDGREDYSSLVRAIVSHKAATMECDAFLPHDKYFVVEDSEGYHCYSIDREEGFS